ncbi:MAG: type sorting protein [Bacteroidetes bacterium]|nr:type sorting protein [Bacteroidota bacterium]
MKKILLTLSSFLSVFLCQAQWAPLNSTTTVKLNDVDFIDENYGVIVGDGNTILLTTDGGITWNDANHHNISGDVTNVTLISTDTMYVSTYDFSSATGTVYYSTDAGLSWAPVAADPGLNHRIDLEMNAPSGKLFASSSHLISSDDHGTTWDTLLSNIAGTTSTDLLHFADSQTGSLSGNISGFIGYSAYFFRTEDAGAHWYAGDPFSFPNSNALTTMCFVNADTAFAFMNQYSGWAPSAVNRLVKIFNFNLSIPSPGDTSYVFSNQMVNTTMPDYMNDARFEDSSNGLAVGNAGKIYRTTNGGTSWTVDYTDTCSSCPILKMDFENGTGYAVGANGILVKYGVTTGTPEAAAASFGIYPNPGHDVFYIKTNSAKASLEVYNAIGELITAAETGNEYRLDLSGYSKGIYFAKLTVNGKAVSKKIVLE